MSDDTKRVRFNLTVDPATRQLVEDYTQEWGLDNGRTLDRLVKMAVGTDAAERQAEAGLGALEEMTRRLLGDYTDLMTRQLTQMLDARFEGPHLEASTARLLLFALLSHLKGVDVAMKNEDAAVRVARRALADGRFPQMPRPAGRGNDD